MGRGGGSLLKVEGGGVSEVGGGEEAVGRGTGGGRMSAGEGGGS